MNNQSVKMVNTQAFAQRLKRKQKPMTNQNAQQINCCYLKYFHKYNYILS